MKLKLKMLSRTIRQTRRCAFTTYSGGQPSDGQGGFYGSLETRSEKEGKFQPGTTVDPADLKLLQQLMKQVDSGESQVAQSSESKELFKRLYIRGSPCWGLSTIQRDFLAKWNI